MENTEEVQGTESELNEDESVAQEPEISEGTEDQATDGETTGAEDTEDYQPDYSYSVRGKDFEFDEDVRPLIKDKQTEDKFRELYSKAGGLDHYKTKIGETTQRFETLQEEHDRLKREREELDFLKANDPRAYCEKIGINYHQMALDDVTEEDLPEEQKQIRQQNREFQLKLAETQREVEQLKTQTKTSAEQAVVNKLQASMERDDVKELLNGGMNDYVERVIIEGEVAKKLGSTITVDEAVGRVVQRFGFNKTTPTSGADKTSSTKAAPKSEKKVIPGTGTPGSTGGKRIVKTTDDLRKLYASMSE